MKKIFATLMVMAILAIMMPLDTFAQTYSYRRVYRNGRWQTVRVYTTTNRGNTYGVRNRNRRVTPQEQRRLARERMRLYNQRARVTRDGRVTKQEARRVNKATKRYVRNVRKARNN